MSGGKFNYNCFNISDFASDLKHAIYINSREATDSHCGGAQLSEETLHVVKQAQRTIAYAGKLAKEIEWLYSSDHSEESFLRLVTVINQEEVEAACKYFEERKDND